MTESSDISTCNWPRQQLSRCRRYGLHQRVDDDGAKHANKDPEVMKPQSFRFILSVDPAPGSSSYIDIIVYGDACDTHGVDEDPCSDDPTVEDLVADTAPLDDGKPCV